MVLRSQLFAPVITRVRGKVLSLFKFFYSNAHFPANVSRNHGIIDALKKNAYDQNEQTIIRLSKHSKDYYEWMLLTRVKWFITTQQ